MRTAEFTAWQENRAYSQDGTQTCRNCMSSWFVVLRGAQTNADTTEGTQHAPAPPSGV